MATAWWTVEVVHAGDPVRVALSITSKEGDRSKPVQLEVPLAILEQGAAQVAHFFIQQRRERYVLREALNLPANITFPEENA